MNIHDRVLAFTDCETSGLYSDVHEILEIGLVLVDKKTITVVDQWHAKVRPEHPETASPEALTVNGYDPREWQEALTLREALALYTQKTKQAIFVAHNVCFDWSFVSKGLQRTSLESTFDYHRLDLFSIAWHALKDNPPKSFKLKDIAQHLGLPEEPMPHRAINGAMTAYEVYKILMLGEKK